MEQWREYISRDHFVRVRLYRANSTVIRSAEMTFDGFKLTAIESLNKDEFCWKWDPESFSPSVHHFALSISFENSSGIHRIQQVSQIDLSFRREFHSQHTSTLLKMKWIEPGFALVLLLGFFVLLLVARHSIRSYELLLPTNLHSLWNRIRRVISIPVLYYLFLSCSTSLLFGVYFVGKMDGCFFVAFAWGVFSYSSERGLEYAFWMELVMWGAIILVGIVLPMLFFCMMHIRQPRVNKSPLCSLLVTVAIVVCFVQYVLLFFNFPFHVCILSLNLFSLPLIVVAIPLCFFKKSLLIVCYTYFFNNTEITKILGSAEIEGKKK